MCQKAAADVTWAVTARCGAWHALCLARLPCELDAIQVAVLLSLGCYGASWCTSMGCILSCHVSLTITTRDWTPEGTEKTSSPLRIIVNFLLLHIHLKVDTISSNHFFFSIIVTRIIFVQSLSVTFRPAPPQHESLLIINNHGKVMIPEEGTRTSEGGSFFLRAS